MIDANTGIVVVNASGNPNRTFNENNSLKISTIAR
jgi:hypothetical protein